MIMILLCIKNESYYLFFQKNKKTDTDTDTDLNQNVRASMKIKGTAD